jgi:hypothetical protein
VSDRDDDNRAALLVENHTPIADPKPQSFTPFKSFHVAFPARGKLRQTRIDASTDLGRKFDPLPSARGRKDNRLHGAISRLAIKKSRPLHTSGVLRA